MWAYKLAKAVQPFGGTYSAKSVRGGLPPDTVAEFDKAQEIAINMARSLGWDRTIIFAGLQCFLSFTAEGYAYGFLIVQATSGARFVVSPVPLAYLDDELSWDAHTSLKEVREMHATLGVPHTVPPPLSWTGKWSTSRSGNPYTFINGAQVTVFPADDGFKAIIASQTTDLKVFTRSFSTQGDVVTYVIKNFYTLVKDWTYDAANKSSAEDNPFVGIDWGDDT